MVTAGSFSFDGYDIDKGRKTLYFRYSLSVNGTVTRFEEKILLPRPIPSDISDGYIGKMMQNLLIVLGMSYWKTTCSPSITIKPFSLTKSQAEFWNTLYTKGMGEFFYRNKIDYRNLVNFPFDPDAQANPLDIAVQDKQLVGIGGGKDSIVTAKLLSENSIPFDAITFEKDRPFPVIDRVIEALNASVLRIGRIIDPQLFALNSQGFYNGHIPISSVYAFLGLAAASFYGYKYMIVSNEKSADSGNVAYLGEVINHQWSKSEEFERLFRDYVAGNITEDVIYFSFLRPLNELSIVKQFVKYKEFFPLFSSCNSNFTMNRVGPQDKKWCGHCPKCAFAFAMFAAYLPKDSVISIFGKNLFEDPSQVPTYQRLLGVEEFKPFECVGTSGEVSMAFSMISQKHEFDGLPAMNMFLNEVLPGLDRGAIEREMEKKGNDSMIPGKFLSAVTKLI